MWTDLGTHCIYRTFFRRKKVLLISAKFCCKRKRFLNMSSERVVDGLNLFLNASLSTGAVHYKHPIPTSFHFKKNFFDIVYFLIIFSLHTAINFTNWITHLLDFFEYIVITKGIILKKHKKMFCLPSYVEISEQHCLLPSRKSGRAWCTLYFSSTHFSSCKNIFKYI